MFLLHVSLPRPVHPRGALMRRRDVGRGRRLRPGFTRTPGSGAPRPVRAARASGMPVRDPTAPYYGGAAPSGARVGARDTAGRVRLGGPQARLRKARSAETESRRKCGRTWVKNRRAGRQVAGILKIK